MGLGERRTRIGAMNGALQRYRLTVAYDGGPFEGWQVQGDRPTVQKALGDACAELNGGEVMPMGSGRTDTGVHARGQVAHVDLPKRPSEKWLLGLNAVLPGSIRVLAVEEAAAGFHARFDATGKEYRYHAWCGAVPLPWLTPVRWVRRDQPDVAAMQAAANRLIGEHDFAAFSASRGVPDENTVRRIDLFEVTQEGPELLIRVRGNGFLYKMVRSLVGFLFRVGEGGLAPADVGRLLAAGERTHEVPTAPAQGLFLWRVDYGGPDLPQSDVHL